MKDSDIYCKTGAGLLEVRDRALKLPQRLRTMLIMVDGTRSVAQLKLAARTLGAPETFLDELLALDLVEPDRSRQRSESSSSRAAEPASPAPAPAPAPTPTRTVSEGDGERFRAALKFMNDSAVDLLGLRAFFLTLKLEKCFTREDLLALLPEFSKAIAKQSGPEMARALEERARNMLG